MCGIVGYIGPQESVPVLLNGLSKLEYRGYDSAGVAVLNKGQFSIVRAEGKLAKLVAKTQAEPVPGTLGIGHTRWATHGAPTERNAHPHRSGDFVLVHNGIIENFSELRKELAASGRTFTSDTDTEIVAHLIDEAFTRPGPAKGDFLGAVKHALKRIHGAWALVILHTGSPDTIIVSRNASPLVLGLGEGENFVASDIPALLSYTRKMVFLEDGDLAVIKRDSVAIYDQGEHPVQREVKTINWSPAMAEKAGHKHFMHKEIHEQPRAVIDTLLGRLRAGEGDVVLDGAELTSEEIRSYERATIIACGTSWHAGLVGKFLFEKLARFPVEVDLASEYRYRDPVLSPKNLLIAVSQSGETLDTLAALKDARKQGVKSLAVCNVVESSIARESDHVFYTHAGPEIGVASTKAFTTQLVNLALLAIHFGRVRGTLSAEKAVELTEALTAIPGHIEEILKDEALLRTMAEKYSKARDFLYLARGINYPVALEGALKLKEISYIHAEGYPAGEMKHGPIALIDEALPVVTIVTRNSTFEKTLSNIQEVRARGGQVIAITTKGDTRVREYAQDVFEIPAVPEMLEPILTVVPLQLLAYHVADHNGTDVDQPRNLAKSVTVE
jgi:glutamine---fructose-6-phosphate transaminase (isomerizing)